MEEEKSRSSTEPLIVREPAAALLLTRRTTLRPLEPFLGRERSVAEAAAETGAKPNTTLARVRRMVELGLLEETRQVARNGRPVRLYRSVADVFFVPFDASGADSLETALAERDAYWEALLRRSVVRARRDAIGTWGTRIYRDARDRVQIQAAVTPDRNYTMLARGAPAVLSAWRDELYLDYEDAKALQNEMFELLMRYSRKRGAQRYIARLGLAPVLPDR